MSRHGTSRWRYGLVPLHGQPIVPATEFKRTGPLSPRAQRTGSHLGIVFEGPAREAVIPMTTATVVDVSTEAMNSGADLLLGVSKGDPTSWNEILRRYGALVSATVRSFRLQDADARDAVQMTWLRLAENAHRVQFPDRLAGWLATTARRECLRIMRQGKAGAKLIDVETVIVADRSAGPEERVIGADTTRMVWTFVDELSPRQRTVLRTLFTDQTVRYAEVARVAGIPAGAIGPTRARALRQLRDKLDAYGLGITA